MSISLALSTSSLENVTQLSDKYALSSGNLMQQAHFQNDTVSNSNSNSNSPCTSFSTTKSDYVDFQQENTRPAEKRDSTHSTPSAQLNSADTSPSNTTSDDQSLKLLTSEEIRLKQKQLFNLSLFDSSLSNASSLPSPLSSTNEAPNTNIAQSYNNTTNLIEYGALIYDSLLTNNLTDLQSSAQTTQNNLTNSTTQQQQNQQKQQQQQQQQTPSLPSHFLKKDNTENMSRK